MTNFPDLVCCGKEVLTVADTAVGFANIPGVKRIGPVTQSTGSGLSDLTMSGTYSGNITRNYKIIIDGTGTPDTFKVSDDGGVTWQNLLIEMTGAAQLLNHGVYVTFAATTGHTLDNAWTFTAYPDSMPAQRANCSLENGQIRFLENGDTPTTLIGQIAEIGDRFNIVGIQNIYNFKAIRTGTDSGSVQIEYFY